MKPKQILFYLLAFVFTISSAFAQDGTVEVTGLVKDKTGMLIVGANVTEKGTKNAVATTASGLFTIRVKNSSAILVFTAVGYAAAELPVVTTGNMVVEMDVKAEDLSEVAVVGYGRQKKISVVGSQITVKPDDLKIPVRDLTNALAGRLAGVVAVQRSGEPGYDASSIFIRGVSTFASSPRSPLLVVDGVPDRSINNIDPEDIESFTILKDASATAVFGTRGA
ncbi:MAG TPA: TonB-dependent receptor plug domain-containing protein, partial [Lacibacter sp.]|nr:TonB-dependent receptor plug domain-containing protein [Lacibacter sp.]